MWALLIVLFLLLDFAFVFFVAAILAAGSDYKEWDGVI